MFVCHQLLEKILGIHVQHYLHKRFFEYVETFITAVIYA